MTESEEALGVTTEALVMDDHPVELGYLSVLGVEPIYGCLDHHGRLPASQAFIASLDAYEAGEPMERVHAVYDETREAAYREAREQYSSPQLRLVDDA